MSHPVMAAKWFIIGCLKSTRSQSDNRISSYCAQAIACIFYNVNIRTVEAAIFFS